MWWEEQSAVRFNIFASISQAFSFQLIKSFQSRRFTIVLYYEAAGFYKQALIVLD